MKITISGQQGEGKTTVAQLIAAALQGFPVHVEIDGFSAPPLSTAAARAAVYELPALSPIQIVTTNEGES